MNCKNFPDTPQGDTWDFFKLRTNFPTSIGDVLIIERSVTFSIFSKFGGASVCPLTEFFEEK